jgi:hypothetical protein
MSGEQGTLFDERFMGRYAGAIMSDPTTALVELVANAWDAYATHVDIQWPDTDTGSRFHIVDNGKARNLYAAVAPRVTPLSCMS